LLQRGERRLNEDEHLGGGVERELLDGAAKARRRATKSVRSAATVARVSAKGSGMASV